MNFMRVSTCRWCYLWHAGSDVDQTVRVVGLQHQTTAHATRLFHSPPAHSSCTREAASSVHAVKSIWSTGGLVWTLSG